MGGRQGDLIVTCHGGKDVTVWKKRKPKRRIGRRLAESRSAKTKRTRKQEENRDPWAYAPYFKTQQLEEDLGTAVCVAMTADGKRFFSSAGLAIRCWVQGQKCGGGSQGPAVPLRVDHAGAYQRCYLLENCP